MMLSFPSGSFAESEDDEETRSSPLDGQPAVRNRLLLVKRRLEASLAFEGSVNADYKHTLAAGLKLEYHFTDMFSFGAVGFFGKSINTGLSDRIITELPVTPESDPAPSKTQYQEHINDISNYGAVYVGITPWYGKLAAFGAAFVSFDFYFQAGVAGANLTNSCCSFSPIDENPQGDMNNPPDRLPRNDRPLNDGFRLGLYLGGGAHVFLNDWIALDLTVRDYIFKNNPSGLDTNRDLLVSGDDAKFLNHLFMGVGVSFMLPPSAKRTP